MKLEYTNELRVSSFFEALHHGGKLISFMFPNTIMCFILDGCMTFVFLKEKFSFSFHTLFNIELVILSIRFLQG